MKLTATIDNIALAALIFAVVAITAVSTVAIVSAERLVATNEKILQSQRIVSSIEAIRFHSLALAEDRRNAAASGSKDGARQYPGAVLEIEGELAYLSVRKNQAQIPERQFKELDAAAHRFIGESRSTRAAGSDGGRGERSNDPVLIDGRLNEKSLEDLLGATHQLLVQARRTLDALEIDQAEYGAKVRRLILALISSSAFILVFLYGTLRRLNLEQRASQARIAHQATHDSLTGLFNRPAVMEYVSARLRDPETEAALGGFALLLLDLDGFKGVNDNLGHDAGDALLREGARRAQMVLRDSDYIARLGGDEFLVVIPQVSDQESAGHVAQKLIVAIGAPYLLNGKAATVTTSIGVSLFPRDARDREGLMKCADLALYEAKRTGKNVVRYYEPRLKGGLAI